jgi:diacylglycerol kinase family enzyme
MLAAVPRALLVVNPFASRVTDDAVERVAAVLEGAEVVRTERAGHATELLRSAVGAVEAIYVFSGDGGFNEALNGADARTPLGFVPGGGTSVLPRALGLPRDPVAAARRLASARPRRISVGRVNGRRFGFSAGLGLDAELIRRVEALGRTSEGRRAGDVAFARTALALLWERRFRLEPALELVGLGRVAFALVANCDPYTYLGRVALHIAPQARFELGLDVVGPNAVTPSSIPRFLAYAVRGRGQERARDVFYGHDLDRVEAVCDRPLPLQADGEDLGDVTEAVFEAERDAVAVLA